MDYAIVLVFIFLTLHSYHSFTVFYEEKGKGKHSLQLYPAVTCDLSVVIGAQASRGV